MRIFRRRKKRLELRNYRVICGRCTMCVCEKGCDVCKGACWVPSVNCEHDRYKEAMG